MKRIKASKQRALIIFILLLHRNPVIIGGDEGMEFMKALIAFRDPGSVPKIWNDQPFLYTATTAGLFHVFGPSASIPRLTTLSLVAGLLLSLSCLLPSNAKAGAKWTCVVLFFTWQLMPELSAAAMCELPAMALGVISVALFRACASFRTWWLPLFAGFSFGLALHLKLTAALVIPGAMAVMFVQRTYKDFAIVSAVAATTFALGLLCTPAWNWNEVIGAHWAAQAAAPNNPYFRIPLSDFTNNLGTIAAALAAVLFYASERNLREIAFPLVFLATVAAVHSVHRPWWEYYHVHFAIPLAMLGALGFSLLWSRSGLTSAVAEPSSKGAGYAVALASIVALWCCFDVRFTMNRLRIVEAAIESIHGNDLLGRMAAFSSQTHLAYASGPGEAYLFHAGLLTPPELVILSYKRKWATGFGDERILGVLKHYEPEQLLLSRENDLAKPGWREFTQANYVLTYVSSDWYLYIHKKLHPKALPTGEALVKHFQL